MATPPLLCANCPPDGNHCHEVGKSSCGNCRLVVYCGSECQKAHWYLHRLDCKSFLANKNWIPYWALTNRTPAFVGEGAGSVVEGKKYLWGNVPTLDVLQLGSNEGDKYQGNLSLLFAASGDMRNVVKTIAELPSTYDRDLDIVMNDRDLDVVARNVILLLLALTAEGKDETIDCMIHVWYSAFIRKSDLEILNQRVRPLIKDVCDNIKGKLAKTMVEKTWTFGQQRSLKLGLAKSSWEAILGFMKVPDGLTTEKANKIRMDVTLHESGRDYRDRSFLFLPPAHRLGRQRFREDGLLLPFGTCRSEFQLPNPTFFKSTDSWPLHGGSDPLHGWSMKDIEATSTGPATSDIYGKLFHHLRSLLKGFLECMERSTMSFRLLQMDAIDLPNHLAKQRFDRIEVSNISDGAYLGINTTVSILSPVLEPPSVNPHATLITLFMNLVDENVTREEQIADVDAESPSSKCLSQFLPLTTLRIGHYDPGVTKLVHARDHARDFDYVFERISQMLQLSEYPRYMGVAIKEKHTIVEKWPFRLKLKPEQKGSKEEFDLLMRGSTSGKELYLEWKRILG
ncbi:hypothetical protein FPOA_02200 [Fusarium poae]|uniref:MYND-type domain-containing protein n=1 Tax=Fusarium poae TaxID=36050 RepID=A0A1B8B6B7_FUSPO|nr:hypothetical protein FPOA_02200 [Fusarium poae]